MHGTSQHATREIMAKAGLPTPRHWKVGGRGDKATDGWGVTTARAGGRGKRLGGGGQRGGGAADIGPESGRGKRKGGEEKGRHVACTRGTERRGVQGS